MIYIIIYLLLGTVIATTIDYIDADGHTEFSEEYIPIILFWGFALLFGIACLPFYALYTIVVIILDKLAGVE